MSTSLNSSSQSSSAVSIVVKRHVFTSLVPILLVPAVLVLMVGVVGTHEARFAGLFMHPDALVVFLKIRATLDSMFLPHAAVLAYFIGLLLVSRHACHRGLKMLGETLSNPWTRERKAALVQAAQRLGRTSRHLDVVHPIGCAAAGVWVLLPGGLLDSSNLVHGAFLATALVSAGAALVPVSVPLFADWMHEFCPQDATLTQRLRCLPQLMKRYAEQRAEPDA